MTVIVPKRELEAVGGYDESLKAVEDFDLFARLARRGPFVGCAEVTGEYRQHPAQTTRARNQQVAIECVQVRKRSLDALRDSLTEAERAQVEERVRWHWIDMLRDEWRSGVVDTFDVLLGMHQYVPGAEPHVWRWRVRRALLWHPWRFIIITGRRLQLRRLWNRSVGAGLAR
jgi:hypothetical protein